MYHFVNDIFHRANAFFVHADCVGRSVGCICVPHIYTSDVCYVHGRNGAVLLVNYKTQLSRRSVQYDSTVRRNNNNDDDNKKNAVDRLLIKNEKKISERIADRVFARRKIYALSVLFISHSYGTDGTRP